MWQMMNTCIYMLIERPSNGYVGLCDFQRYNSRGYLFDTLDKFQRTFGLLSFVDWRWTF